MTLFVTKKYVHIFWVFLGPVFFLWKYKGQSLTFPPGHEKLDLVQAFMFPKDEIPSHQGSNCIDKSLTTACKFNPNIEFLNVGETKLRYPYLVVELKDPSYVLAVSIYETKERPPNPQPMKVCII